MDSIPEGMVEEVELPKERRNKPLRAFNYRGVAFFLAKKDSGTTSIYVMNRHTSSLDLQAEVDTPSAVKAAQALAKIVIAERELEAIQALGKLRIKKTNGK